METLIQKITDAGIRTDVSLTPDIEALPSYRGNFGFYHVIGQDWELILIKGVYKGNIRPIKGKCPHTDKAVNEMAQMLADAERCLRHPAELRLTLHDEKFVITKAKAAEQPFIQKDGRDFLIPEPLTPVEASLGRHSAINEKHLFTGSPFSSVFGNTMSPFAYSVLESVPDIMNPLFISSAIKTHSPSLKPLFGRFYININNIETIISAFSTTPDLFYMNFLPSIYMKLNKPSFDMPDLKLLGISDDELNDTLKDVIDSAKRLNESSLFSDDFSETLALCVMLFEMAYLNLWKHFAAMIKLTGSVESAMAHVYKTLDGGLLKDGGKIMPSFDPAYTPVRLVPLEFSPTSVKDMYKTLHGPKRLLTAYSKYAEKLELAHKAVLDMDKTFKALSDMAKKVREILLGTGNKLMTKSVIPEINDIFYLEHKEIKSMLNDEFYGNVPFTLNFRKWQNHRQSALCLPAFLYEKDVETSDTIAAKQIVKFNEDKAIPCLSFFHKEIETENFACAQGFFITDINDVRGKDAVIAESASIFSYIARYCAVTDTPFYTGARYAALLLKGRIKTEKGCIRI